MIIDYLVLEDEKCMVDVIIIGCSVGDFDLL